MARKKGLGIFGAFMSAAVKLGSAAAKDIAQQKKTQKTRAAKAAKIRALYEHEKELTRQKLLDDLSSLPDVHHDSTLEQLKKVNQEWSDDFSQLRKFVDRGMYFEKNSQIEAAIESYLKGIRFGETSRRLNYANYGASIKRVIILYGKIKAFDSLRSFLTEVMAKYPDSRDFADWQKRLTKTQNK